MEIRVFFEGGKKVSAEVEGHIIKTDQKIESGGESSAPSPFTLFLSSIGTCVGAYVLGFCQSRGIPYEKITIIQSNEFDPESHRLKKVKFEIKLPPDFPEKYIPAIVKVADKCAVKRTILDPPQFEITTNSINNEQ